MIGSVFSRSLLATTAIFAASFPAWAQDAAERAPSAAAREDAADTGDVVVTARRRQENIRDVPISVQAISGETLEEKGTIDLQSLIAQTPGLNSTGGNPRNFSVLIRGIGYAPTAADGLDNAIGVYFDGVYQARPGQVLQDLVDVNSFEVLRGPQGTLFGRNAAAGALNVTFNRPSFTPSQTFEGSYGNYDFTQGKAILTGPITDNIAFRTALYATYGEGWIPTPFKVSFANAVGQQGIYAPTATRQTETAGTWRWGIRQQFLINAGEGLSINISGDLNVENDSSAGFSSGGGIAELYGPGNWGPNTTAALRTRTTNHLAALSQLASFGGVQSWNPTVNPNVDITNSLNRMHTKNGGLSVTVDNDLGWADLTSITAWRRWEFYPPQDSDASPIDIYNNMAISQSDGYSQEIRLASNDEGPIEWQTGVFGYYSQLKDHYVIHQFGADVIPYYNAYNTIAGTALGPNYAPIPLSFRDQLTGKQIIEDTTVQNQNWAVYGQATWHITDTWDLTGGLRYTYDRKSGSSVVDTSQLPTSLPVGVTNTQLNTFYTAIDAIFRNPGVNYASVPGYPAGIATVGYPLGAVTSADNVSGTVSLSHDITPDATAYITYSTGYQAAGLDLNNGTANPTQVALRPTTTDNIEVGIKAALFDHSVRLNLALYEENLEGFQTAVTYFLPNGSSYRGATNAGDIRARGVEWSLATSLGNGFSLTFDGNYNDSKYTRAPSLPSPPEVSYLGSAFANVSATGQRAPYSPEWSVSLTPSWDAQIAAGTEFYTYAQYTYTSDFYTGAAESAYQQVPDQFNLNLRAGLRFNDGKYDLSLYANNATDEENIASQNLLRAPQGTGTTAYIGRSVSYSPPARYGVTLRAKF